MIMNGHEWVFRIRDNLNFPLLADPDHRVAEAFGVWGEKSLYGRRYMGVFRSTFILAPDGTILHVFQKANPKTHLDDILEWTRRNL